MPSTPRLQQAAKCLLHARQSGQRVSQLPESSRPENALDAYAVQDLQLQQMGPVVAWKVGAASPTAEPNCAPITANSLVDAQRPIDISAICHRGVEVEIGVLLGQDLPPRAQAYGVDEVLAAIGSLCVAVEMVDFRFSDPEQVDRWSKMADFSGHGLVTYSPHGIAPDWLHNAPQPQARLALSVSGQQSGPSQNPVGDIPRLLTWLANHASQRGLGLRSGQLIITGSCLPALRAQPGERIQATLESIGSLELVLAA